MPRGNSKKGTPARGQGVKRRRMTDLKEKETASEVNPRSSGESVIDFSSVQGPSQTSTGTELNSFNENIQFSQSLLCLEESLFDQIGCYVPMKLKDKIWKHEFIDLSLLIKSPRELANFPDQEGDLVRNQLDFFSDSLAGNTWKSYSRARSVLASFQLLYTQDNVWPVPVEQLVQFIAYLSLKHLSPATVRLYISGISFSHKARNLEDTTKNFVVSKVLEGLHRNYPQRDNRAPITLPLLRQITDALLSICTSTYESLLFKSSFIFGIFRYVTCYATKELTKKKDMLSELAFSGRHAEQSVWVISQRYNSVLKDLREQTKWLCMFYTKDRDSFDNCLRENDVIPTLEERQRIKEELKKKKHRKLILKTDQPTDYWLLN
ncbi:unnamed protein product [Mytilus coruscus]|uniref:Uncharacterized protein n=1 Tax=Mytilus coruscus TaxID=42192 RepID=A0A6J8B1A4_MYTCO|nr:unnamed protein product [Mytilus coruscus]